MATTEREKHIENLETLKAFLEVNPVFKLSDEMYKSLDYAISSLKTDLKYDLLYEGEEIYTKADMIIMLEDLLMEIKHTVTMEEDTSSNEDLVKRDNVMKVVQSRIDKLKEEKK